MAVGWPDGWSRKRPGGCSPAGVVPTYLHDPANTASAKVADAAGFPDRGWTVLGMAGPRELAEAAGDDG